MAADLTQGRSAPLVATAKGADGPSPGALRRSERPSAQGATMRTVGPEAGPRVHIQRATLSPRQALCLRQVALGQTSGEIAQGLRLSVRTVDQYIAEGCARLGVKKRASAVAEALRLGLISLG